VSPMTTDERTCALCGEPIDADQAWMTADDGVVAHSGCVYSDVTNVEQRDRWMPSVEAETRR
jgi:hypothetical protein